MSDSDSGENAIWVLVIVGAIVFIFLAFFKRWLDERKKRQDPERDTEILDRSIEIHDGKNCFETVGEWLFSSCYSVENEGSSKQEHELEGAAAAASTATGINGSKGPVSKDDVKNALSYLQRLQQIETKEVSSERIRQAQSIILMQQPKPTESSLQTVLIIGVDATPNLMGGYCVNLREKKLEYYVIKTGDYPWKIENRDDPNEFEMKNLQFACLIWGKRIRKYKKFRIYTDNNAINDVNCVFGSDADDLLNHFEDCEDGELVNEQIHVNRKQNLEFFAKYIQPADDFSRWEIDKGIDFLCEFYGICKKNVRGTIQRAQTFARNLKCENCIFSFMGPRPQSWSTVGQTRSKQVKALQRKNKRRNSLRQVLHQNRIGQSNNRGKGMKRC